MNRAATWLHRHGRARLALLLTLPSAWLLLIYLVPLALLFLTAFWRTDSFTGGVIRQFTTQNFWDVLAQPAYLAVLGRTVAVAVAVTVVCGLLAVPMALFMAKVATPRWQPLLLALVLTPLWASYLVKVYAWRSMLAPGAVIEAMFGATPGYGWTAVVVVLSYLWLPYMVLPVYTGMTTMKSSLLDAAADLGAGPWTGLRTVVLPLVAPSLVAGSVFTFSLSMGDYITAQLVGGTGQMLGSVVYQNFSVDLPFSAALATLPVIVMIGYLAAVRRTGALQSL